MLVLNDAHLGVQRSGGTTPSSREALRNYLFGAFEGILHDTTENHVCILGDLFDTFEVAGRDWVQCYMVLQDWLARPNGGKQHLLTLVAGNHDHSPKALRVSSFEMLCAVLVEQFGAQVKVLGIDQFDIIDTEVYALSHCSNQDIFNEKLGKVLGLVGPGSRVLLHTNYDNHFAAASDHSLNVSEAQAQEFSTKGATLYFAHEHQARTALGGSVVVLGNQWPSSVSDCLNNDSKFAHIFNGGVTKVQTWAAHGTEAGVMNDLTGFITLPWNELDVYLEANDSFGFVRVTGTASSNQAGDCISAIAKFRAKSNALVITNAVKIEGIVDNEALPEAFEAAKTFDVLEFINSNLDTEQQAAVAKLLEV